MTPKRRSALDVAARLAGQGISKASIAIGLELFRDSIDTALWDGMQAAGDQAAPAVKCDAAAEEQQCKTQRPSPRRLSSS